MSSNAGVQVCDVDTWTQETKVGDGGRALEEAATPSALRQRGCGAELGGGSRAVCTCQDSVKLYVSSQLPPTHPSFRERGLLDTLVLPGI